MKACGAEAALDMEEDERNVAYWFKVTVHSTIRNPRLLIIKSDLGPKLHLHPANASSQDFEIPPLPTGISIEQVYADLMGYLMEHTRRFFEATTVDGAEIWKRVRDTIVIVLATPNVWGIREQATLRKSAVMASIVTEENASQLLQFVTEAEASVHYALAQDHSKWLKEPTVFAVIDCGGSTVDTTVYRCISTAPLSLTETCPSECAQVVQSTHSP